MTTPISLKEALAFAAKELKAANLRNAVVDDHSDSAVYLTVRRSFAIEGCISVAFDITVPEKKGGPCGFKPKVSVNFPACNKDIVRAAAFMGLVNELVPLAAGLQTQLDELKVEEKL